MKLWIFSDLHLEFGWMGLDFEVPDADVCIVAGDVEAGGPARSIEFFAEYVPDMPVVFVCGNHEFYKDFLFDGLTDGIDKAAGYPNIHLLENRAVEIGDLAIAGATLWSDFRLIDDQDLAMRYCEEVMTDYHSIRWSKKPYRPLRAFHTFRKHAESVEFLNDFLANHRERRTIVVTHHAPSIRSIAPARTNDTASAAFASNLEAMIVDRGPEMWIHGHVHYPLDYMIGKTRVICNPRGYYGDPNFRTFDLGFVIDV